MESISDVVFGLALEIGSVFLIAQLPQNPGGLGLDILEFGFNFLIVVMAWLSYRRAVVTLPHETPNTVLVNIALLFSVSIEPFLFYVLVSQSGILETASTAYALDVGVMMLLLSTYNYLLLREERNAPDRRIHPALIERIRRTMVGRAWIGVLFLVSSLPVFWIPTPGGETLRIDLWFLGLSLILLVSRFPAGLGKRPTPSNEHQG
jgi:uncharacterized membrane protein